VVVAAVAVAAAVAVMVIVTAIAIVGELPMNRWVLTSGVS
jgi:hypothetical protein